MRILFFIAIQFFWIGFVCAQHHIVIPEDPIMVTLDSMSKLYYFDKLEHEDEPNKYNYTVGFVPVFHDTTYVKRIKELDKNSPFDLRFNPTVKQYINNYTRSQKSLGTILSLSKLYFPLFEEYLIKYNLPLELKYLSVVESALNPTARSWCGAAGLWQFMYATGKAYDLNINSYVDERYNMDKATDAACRYLKDLFAIYQDWSLAIAAYNCGAGNVNKAIKKAGKKDFWDIRPFLPKETQNYVPAFIAAVYSLNYADEHNIPRIKTAFLFSDLDFITIDKTVTLDQLAKQVKIHTKQLRYLNPCYYIGVVPGNNDKITLPRDAALNYLTYAFAKQRTDKPASEQEAEKPLAKKDPFGTIVLKNQPEHKFLKTKSEEVIICQVFGDYRISKGVETLIRVRNLNETTVNGSVIQSNSVFIGKVKFINNEPVIVFSKVLSEVGESSVNFKSEIHESLLKGSLVLDDGYTIYMKVNSN